MRKILSFLLLMSIATYCVAADVHLDLRVRENFLIISIENFSLNDIKVSRLFTQNPAFGLIVFHIMADGHNVGFKSPPNENFPSRYDYIILRPFDVFGRALSISEIRRSYDISSKCFLLSVEYRDVLAKKFNSLPLVLKSNQVRICQ